MSALRSEQALCRTFRLSARLSVEITVGPAGMAFEWDPAMPASMSAKEVRRYRSARNEMLEELARMVGGTVLLLEATR